MGQRGTGTGTKGGTEEGVCKCDGGGAARGDEGGARGCAGGVKRGDTGRRSVPDPDPPLGEVVVTATAVLPGRPAPCPGAGPWARRQGQLPPRSQVPDPGDRLLHPRSPTTAVCSVQCAVCRFSRRVSRCHKASA